MMPLSLKGLNSLSQSIGGTWHTLMAHLMAQSGEALDDCCRNFHCFAQLVVTVGSNQTVLIRGVPFMLTFTIGSWALGFVYGAYTLLRVLSSVAPLFIVFTAATVGFNQTEYAVQESDGLVVIGVSVLAGQTAGVVVNVFTESLTAVGGIDVHVYITRCLY